MRALRSRLGLLGTLALSGLVAPAGAQPVGSEFQINTYTTENQITGLGKSIAAGPSGNFIVVWASCCPDDFSYSIFGQRYDSAGGAVGSEFRVNSYTTHSQASPSIAADGGGNLIVVWESSGQDGSGYGVFGQRYDNDGRRLGAEFRVNSHTPSSQHSPSVASDTSGNFVVVWSSGGQDGSSYGIFGQRYDSAGVARGNEFRVNSFTTGRQSSPAIAADANGNFVVVWAGEFQDGDSFGIFGQRYDSAGGPVGSEFRVNSYTTDNQGSPSVASDASGNFVVVWRDFSQQDGSLSGIFGQRYDSTGSALGSEFQVNSYTSQDQEYPSVAADASGNFVVLWASGVQDGSSEAIFAQRFDNAGEPIGLQFRVNSYTSDQQWMPTVAVTGVNQFVAAWWSYEQDGSRFGVFGQRFDFGGPAPVVLHVGDLDGKAKNVGARWRALVKVMVHDDSHNPVGDALVLFTRANGSRYTCITTASGQCEISLVVSDIARSLTFTVRDVSKVGIGYDAGANHDPDPDSDGTVIVVNQP